MVSKEMPASQQNKNQGFQGLRLLAAHPVFIGLLLVVTTFISFWPVVDCGFINYDDPDYVSSNPRVLEGLNWKNVGWAFTTDHCSNWHPLTWLSHMLDVTLFGTGPAGPHGVNLLLHTTNVLLLFFLLKRMTGALWRSAFVAALFALHPLHVESVAWVAERKDVLSTLFWMLTLLAYVRYVDSFKVPNSTPQIRYAQTLFFFALGLMSKPMLVTLPFVMLLLDFWPLQRIQAETPKAQRTTFFRLVLEKTPFLLLSAAACVTTLWAQKNALQPLTHLPLTERITNALVAYCGYLGKTLWPADLALPYLRLEGWPATQVAQAAILVAMLCLGAILTARKYPFVFTGWFWFLGTLVPVIGVVQVGVQSMADRYTYVPLIGVFIILVWGAGAACAHWRLPKPVAGAGAALILAGCGALTRQQAGYWHDSESLFNHAAKVTPNNLIALNNVGGSLFARGKLDEAMDYFQRAYRINPNYAEAANSIGAVLAARGDEEAFEWFRKALAIKPTYADALFNMGNALARRGDFSGAAGYFQQALESQPDNFETRNNLGNALAKLGRIDEATTQYRLALEGNPDNAKIHKNFGEALAAGGKFDEAVLHYRLALIYTNDAGTHYSLGLTLALQGKWEEAIRQYNETLRLTPDNAEAQYNLGYALRVRGRLDESAVHLREALRLRPDFPLAHFNLGCALADQGLREEAIVHLREALRLKPDYEQARQRLDALGVQTEK